MRIMIETDENGIITTKEREKIFDAWLILKYTGDLPIGDSDYERAILSCQHRADMERIRLVIDDDGDPA